MSFDAGSIVATMGINDSPFLQSLRANEAITAVFGQTIQNFLTSPLLAAIDLAKKAASAIANMFSSVVDAGDAFSKLSAKTGASVEFLSGLDYAAKLADVSMEEVTLSLNVLNRSIAEAASGGASGKTFKDLGVSIRDAGGEIRSTEDIFMDLADALARLPNAATRAAAAQDLLGRGSAALGPLLKDGAAGMRELMAEAGKRGLIMTGAEAAAAERFNDALTKMGQSWEGLKRKIFTPIFEALAPVLDNLANKLANVMGPALEAFGRKMREMGPQIADLLDRLATDFVDSLPAILDGIRGIILGVSMFVRQLQQMRDAVEWLLEPVMRLGHALASMVESVAKLREQGGLPRAFDPLGLINVGGNNTAVNVTVDPQASAREVANRIAPAVSREVKGVQRRIEQSAAARSETDAYRRSILYR